MNPKFLDRVDYTGIALVVIVSGIWAVAGTLSAAASVAVGGALALGNLILIRQVMGGIVRRAAADDSGASPKLVALYAIKFLAVAVLIFLLVTVLRVEAMPLAVGMSVVPLAILIEFVRWNASAPSPDPR